jgi:hypothetical protein
MVLALAAFYFFFLQHIYFFSMVYGIATISEWVYHRYGVHLEAKNLPAAIDIDFLRGSACRHLIHHRLTRNDMSLKSNLGTYNVPFADQKLEKFQGIYLLWSDTILIFFLVFMLSNLVAVFVIRMSILSVLIYSSAMTLWMSAIWNSVHAMVHSVDSLPIKDGCDPIPHSWLMNTRFYQYLWKNHVLHHLIHGEQRGNYNVTVPGADYLFGTYHTKCAGFHLDVHRLQVKTITTKK